MELLRAAQRACVQRESPLLPLSSSLTDTREQVGYHNEHHDFPSIPWSRLPALRAAAPEFYDVLPRHTSWCLVTLQFILGHESGLYARIKRAAKGKAAEGVVASKRTYVVGEEEDMELSEVRRKEGKTV